MDEVCQIERLIAKCRQGLAAKPAAWAVAKGFGTMKVKVGFEPEGDVACVRAVREAIGTNVRLDVVVNGGWSPRAAVSGKASPFKRPGLAVELDEQTVERYRVH